MCVDANIEVRKRAAEVIMMARAKSNNTSVRLFKEQTINWDAEHYYELSSFEQVHHCDPPLLRHIPDISAAISSPLELELAMQYPCHSQANEFFVQETHKGVKFTTDEEQLMGFVRVRQRARELNPVLRSKQDYHF